MVVFTNIVASLAEHAGTGHTALEGIIVASERMDAEMEKSTSRLGLELEFAFRTTGRSIDHQLKPANCGSGYPSPHTFTGDRSDKRKCILARPCREGKESV